MTDDELIKSMFVSVSAWLVPVGWPILLVCSAALGTIGVGSIRYGTRDLSSESLHLRESSFGMSLLIGLGLGVVWILVSCLVWAFSEEGSGGHLAAVAAGAIPYGLCAFGVSTFVLTVRSVVLFFTHSPEDYPGFIEDETPLALPEPGLSDSQRRGDARAMCEQVYWQFAEKLGTRFTRDDFSRYVDTFLSDAEPAATVEARADSFQSFLEGMVHDDEPTESQPLSIEQVEAWYRREIEKLESLSTDQRTRDRISRTLLLRYHELIEAAYEDIEP